MKCNIRQLLAIVVLVSLGLTACGQAAAPLPTLIPVETSVALTLQAMQAANPATDTPVPPTPTLPETPTVGVGGGGPAQPVTNLPLGAPGAQCVPANAEGVQARVLQVIDGESIEVAIGNDVYRVRYLGVDAPSPLPPLEWKGPESMATNRTLVGSQIAILVKGSAEIDEEGRMLRYVFVGNTFVNYEMIRSGYASVAVDPPTFDCMEVFLGAENEARASLAGIWSATPTFTMTPTNTFTPTPLGGPSTPTYTPTPPCSCERSIDCNNFNTQGAAQACYQYCKSRGIDDIFSDNNNNGLVCEGLPR